MVLQRKLLDKSHLEIYLSDDQEDFEKRIQEEVCLVLSDTEFRHMTLQRFKDAVVFNLNRGVRYRYIIPRTIPFREHFDEFRKLIAKDADVDSQLFQSVTLDPMAFGLVTPLALFDPASPKGHGYIRHFTGNTYLWLKLQLDRLEHAYRSFEFHWQNALPARVDPFVFISYASTDSVLADSVAQTLNRIGIDYFMDKQDINWGDGINDKIKNGLARATHVIILVSHASVRSGWVSYEVGYAIGRGKTILPLLVHPSTKIPEFMNGLHCKSDVEAIACYFREILQEGKIA